MFKMCFLPQESQLSSHAENNLCIHNKIVGQKILQQIFYFYLKKTCLDTIVTGMPPT
jgi:hypothetical protein